MIPTVVWGTGNVGRATIRAVEAHPAMTLAAVLVHDPAKVGRDAGELGGLGRPLGVAATDDIAAVLAVRAGGVPGHAPLDHVDVRACLGEAEGGHGAAVSGADDQDRYMGPGSDRCRRRTDIRPCPWGVPGDRGDPPEENLFQ